MTFIKLLGDGFGDSLADPRYRNSPKAISAEQSGTRWLLMRIITLR